MQNDALDKALFFYLRSIAPPANLMTRKLEYKNESHRSGVSRYGRQYYLVGEEGEYSIYAKQYGSQSLAQREFGFLQACRTHVSCKDGVSSVEPLFVDDDVVLCAGAEGIIGLELFRLSNEERLLLPERFQCIGRWLATFHRSNFKRNTVGFDMRSKDGESYQHFLSALLHYHLRHFSGRYIAPDFASKVRHTLKPLIEAAATSSPYGACHGDFCLQNVVVDVNRGASTVLDFEDLHFGFQIKDQATFCAKLQLLELIFPEHTALIANLEDRFLTGYAECWGGELPDSSLLRFIYLLRIDSALRYADAWRVAHNIRSRIRRIRFRRLLDRELSALLT